MAWRVERSKRVVVFFFLGSEGCGVFVAWCRSPLDAMLCGVSLPVLNRIDD